MMQQHDGIQEASDDSLAKRPDKMFFDIDKPSRNYYDLP